MRVPQVIWSLQQGGSLLCGYLRHLQATAAAASTATAAAVTSATTAVAETRRATVATTRPAIASTAAVAATTTTAVAAGRRLLTIPYHAQPGRVWLVTATAARAS